MTRAEAATWLGERFPDYLDATGRTATDDRDNLGPALDVALLAMGYARSEIATAAPSGDEEEPFVMQAEYRTLAALSNALGATNFNVGLSGNSFSLKQIRDHIREDLADARAAVLEVFGTTTVAGLPNGGIITLDLNYLEDREVVEAVG